MLVRANCDHTEPKTHRYRTTGEEFELSRPLYKHVDPVEEPPRRKKKADADEE